MSAIINASICISDLPKEKFVKAKNGKVYYNFSIGVWNDTNDWGKNVSLTDSQTQEERESKAKKTYIGNGSVVWTDGEIKVTEKQQNNEQQEKSSESTEDNDLPF